MGCKPLDKPKQKHKKGLWSPDEDQKLRSHIMKYGHGCWSSVPVNAGLQRNGKSCRLRWINYLRPGLKRGAFSFEEEETMLKLHQTLGNKWSQIAHHLPGRTDNEIKNYWHSHLKKTVSKRAETEAQVKNACTNGQIQGSELSPSSLNATPQTIFGSFKNMDAFESVPQLIEQSKGIQKCNLLPKVVFAEWLSLDQFQDSSYGSGVDFKCTLDSNSNSEDSLVHDPLLYEGTFGSEVHPKSGGGSVDDILQSAFKFEDQMPEIGMDDYFSGEFNINCDDMYI